MRHTNLRLLSLLLLVMSLILGSVATVLAGPGKPGPDNIVDTAIAINSSGPYAGSFDTLIDLVVNLGLVDTLSSNDARFTVFAPTDEAFAAFIAARPDIVNDPDKLLATVLYHVREGRRAANSIVNTRQMKMLSGEFVSVDGTVLNGSANIIVTNVNASNGYIHAIDSVLIPPSLQ